MEAERPEAEEEPIVIEPEELGEEGEEEERLVVEVSPEEGALGRPLVGPPPFKPVIWRDPFFSKISGGLIGGALGAIVGFFLGGLGGFPFSLLSLPLLAGFVATPMVVLEGVALGLRGRDVGRLALKAFTTGLVGGGLGGLLLHFLNGGGGLHSFLGRLLAFGLAGGAVGAGARRRASAGPARWGGLGGLFGLLCGAWAWICEAIFQGLAIGWALVAVPFGLVVAGGLGLMERLLAMLEVRCLSGGSLVGARCFVDSSRAVVGPRVIDDLPIRAGASVEFEVMPSGVVARPLSGEVEISGGDPSRRVAKVAGVWVEAVLRAL